MFSFQLANVKDFLEHGKKPGEAICAVAERENAILVVLGTRGQSLVRRTLLGSVCDYVVKHSKGIPTLVVP
jgi:nucleotide-binding universal stress UspA family protein